MATELYRQIMEWSARKLNADGIALMHKAWDRTPWMVDAHTGPTVGWGRDRNMRLWCEEAFGPEAWPIHHRPGSWFRSGVTVEGRTWFGFETEEMMKMFLAAWPDPEPEAPE